MICFNSLQTGRHIQTQNWHTRSVTQIVSIPFKREGTFRRKEHRVMAIVKNGFHSLQTGRHIQTGFLKGNRQEDRRSFNSLQTGRHIQTISCQKEMFALMKVSIPFKREGTFRRWNQHTTLKPVCAEGFNSLQTGRHIQTEYGKQRISEAKVSIPFKREGTFRL